MNNKNFDFYIFDMSVGNRKPTLQKVLAGLGGFLLLNMANHFERLFFV